MIDNGVLRCDQYQLDQLLNILDIHDKQDNHLTDYLIKCIEEQYASNYEYLQQKLEFDKTGLIDMDTKINNPVELDR
jgi:hypothetical protein